MNAAAGLPASRLVLEITETVFLDFGSVERANLDGLRAAGVMIVTGQFLAYSVNAAIVTMPVVLSFLI